ncbi:SLAC1 anion channel family protein [Marivivens donghaensis]|uniref:SLAC1 anion channel family protein n=1 Tax=Marivivens donghaensis TaxID=1699413 RepID=UPI003F69AD43
MTDTASPQLRHYPVTLFAIGMGMLGLTLAIHAAELNYETKAHYSAYALWVSVALLAVVSLGYLAKIIRHADAVKAEWNHPVRIAFFPAISISLLLLSAALLTDHKAIAGPLWWIGMALQGVLALSVISAWIGHRSFAPVHVSPAWFIPAVGNVIVPLAGVPLGHTELSWLFFSAGVMFWIVLLTLVINRLMFHDPLPGRLVPTLVILIAPPSVAFIAWTRLSGGVDSFGHILLSLAYVFALIVLTQAPKFMRLPFALSWWALSFPIAALSTASFLYGRELESQSHIVIGTVLLMLLLTIVGGLLMRTAIAVRRGEICQPE